MSGGRNKGYRPRPAGARTLRTQPWKLRNVFQPLENILAQMEGTGFSDVDEHGHPVFRNTSDGGLYTVFETIIGLAEAYEIHASRCGRAMPTEPLRRVANKFDEDSLVSPCDVADMRAAMAALRAETMAMTEDYAHSLFQVVAIQDKLEKVGS